jgi:DNA-directed RNA polymerase subunit beta'
MPENNFKDFEALKIKLASPEKILSWSHGEVLEPETINYRTFRTEKDGLFCEKIFGPVKDYECYCGKYKKIRFRGVVCDKCGVEVTTSKVRRERMGHIALSSPCAHVWFFRGIPSLMATLLGISPRLLESVVYFAAFLVTEIDEEQKVQVLSELEEELATEVEKVKRETGAQIEKITAATEKKIKGLAPLAVEELRLKAREEKTAVQREEVARQTALEEKYRALHKRLEQTKTLTVIPHLLYEEQRSRIERFATVAMGAAALKEVLQQIDLEQLSRRIRKQLAKSKGQKKTKLIKRLRVVEGFRQTKLRPEWMILDVLPVIPPDLRPLVQLQGGRFAASDLNDLYRRVINRNNRLKKLLELGAPEVIVRNEQRMLQEAVDALLDSSRQRSRNLGRRGRRQLRSLSDMLRGKQGRFRLNLLGKRVDYSGRSVIVVGPNLKLDQCGLPREMALELFKPFVLREIILEGLAPNIKSARFVLEERPPEVWDILEKLVKDHPVLLNRAPTLHRLGFQAFYPQLIGGKAIQIHPCVCVGYNADFDGDQMAVHLPLSDPARKESHELMLSTKNLLKPADGVPVAVPIREMVVGTYYLTSMVKSEGEPPVFANEEEALLALNSGVIKLRQPIKVRLERGLLETTAGRLIFNRVLPKSLRFFNDETNKENGAVKKLISACLQTEGWPRTAQLIDDLKRLGFEYAMWSGVSMGIFDGEVVPEKDKLVARAEEKSAEVDQSFRRGLITERERMNLMSQAWIDATNEIDQLTWNNLDKDNPIKVMVSSGARGTQEQVKQIAGIRGMIVDPLGHLVKLPIRSNYRQGLTEIEYFSGARGGRKGMIDTALKTADAGYLTRRLADVAQDVIVREEDCGTGDGLEFKKEEGTLLANFEQRLVGRVAAKDIKVGRKNLVKAGDLIDEKSAQEIANSEAESVWLRSPLTCQARHGICAKCYGRDLTTQKLVAVGAPVGIVAAQSIGEPGTQLTLRTRHMGGIITAKDVTQGLPRVEEIFEARTPKDLGLMSPVAGKVKVVEKEERRFVRIGDFEVEIDPTAELRVADGDLVGAGTPLTGGFLDPSEVMEQLGIEAAQKYILDGVQQVYSSQGVPLADKHIEVIVRQMFSRVKIEAPGDSSFLPGEIVGRYLWEEENERLETQKKEPASAQTILLGITKAALETDSWLAAASFIETTRVLTEAASSGRVDKLLGLKENVIIGRLIPTGERARLE